MRLWILFLGFGFNLFAGELSAPLDFTKITKFMQDRPDVVTVDAFLKELPDEYRKHSVLMHTSQSLQGSSFERPRVLLSVLDGNFALAFTDESQARGNTVEMFSFDRVKRSFEFREIVFDGRRAQLSPANPPLCLGCHGQDPRPIWGSYPVWKGAYAEFRPHGDNDDSADIVAKNTRFWHEQPKLSRYRELHPHGQNAQSGLNVGFMHLVGEANNLRAARMIAATPFFEDYKFAILGAHVCMKEPDQWLLKFLPKALADNHRTAFRPGLLRDHLTGAFTLYSYLFEARGISTAAWPTLIDPLDTRSSSRFSVTEPREFDTFSAGRVAYALATLDNELATLTPPAQATHHGVVSLDNRQFYYTLNQDEKSCDAIAKKSKERLGKLLARYSAEEIFRLSVRPTPRTARDTLQSCAACHDGSVANAPKIPFAEPPELARFLKATPDWLTKIRKVTAPGAGAAQMPPSGALATDEREGLLKFLAEL